MGINQGPISLDQKYTQEHRPRLPDRDPGAGAPADGADAAAIAPQAASTPAGFISGYRGSPLGGYDQQLRARASHLEALQRQVPARRERGSRRDRDLGLAAAQSVARRHGTMAWSASGTARGLASTVAATCSATATPPAPPRRRRAVPRRRRPRRQVLDRAASVGPRLHLGADARISIPPASTK